MSTSAAEIVSPEVHPDRRVTFRIMAKNAKLVRVEGPLKKPVAMTKDDQGVWAVTTEPLPPGIHDYTFSIDGASVTDPRNPAVKKWLTSASMVEVPGDSPAGFALQDVPHGTLHRHWYQSKSLDCQRSVLVYTPPGYDPRRAELYPVTYLLHGFGDQETAWTEVGRAQWIADNLYAKKAAEPMLIVMPYGHREDPRGAETGDEVWPEFFRGTIDGFAKDLLHDVLPLVESHYHASAQAEKRSIVGLSMGGGESISLGLMHPEVFGWVGAFSAAPPPWKWDEKFARLQKNPNDFNERSRLLWIACGRDDFLFKENETFVQWLSTVGLEHSYLRTEGAHTWDVWRRYLEQFLPLLFRE